MSATVFDFNKWVDGDRQRATTTTTAHPPPATDSDEQRRVWSYIEGIAGNQAALIQGSRNSSQNSGAYKAFRLAIGVGIPAEQVEQLIYRAQVLNGQIDDGVHQVRSTMRSARSSAERDGADYLPPPDNMVQVVIDESSNDTPPPQPAARAHIVDIESLERDFWTRPSLRHIKTTALSRMCAPWAVLAHCVARALAFVPTTARLPPLIGDGGGSLNWYAVAVDRSGGGKSASASVAKSLIPYSAETRHLGSGEGLVECYWPAFEPPKDGEEDLANTNPKAFIFQADEIDTIAALGIRSGSTLMPHLRTAFTGGSLGGGFRGRVKQNIPEQEYRLTLVVSAQPRRCAAILADADGGTPQRFMWFPANDPRIRAKDATPFTPIKELQIATNYLIGTYISIPDDAKDFILQQSEMRGNGAGAALDGHAVFCREKFAFALAVLDGRNHMTDEDWALSSIAADVSETTREWASACVADSATEDAEERGRLHGVSAVASDEEKAQRTSEKTRRLGRRLMDFLADGPMTQAAINKKLNTQARPYLAGALQALQAADLIHLDDKKWAQK